MCIYDETHVKPSDESIDAVTLISISHAILRNATHVKAPTAIIPGSYVSVESIVDFI